MFATFYYSMAGDSARFFFILSGEHPTLPLAELKAILHAYAIEHKIVGSFYKLIEIEADRAKLESIASRGAYVDEMGEEVLHTKDNLESIKREVEFANLEPFLSSEDSFSIRMLRFGGVSKELSRVHLEGYLGKLLAEKTGARVDLRTPKKPFRGILAGSLFHLGLIIHQRPKGSIHRRRPRKRAVFHPSTMPPKIARCLVNLSEAKDGETFLDPFCGVGGIAIEASLLGCNVVGSMPFREWFDRPEGTWLTLASNLTASLEAMQGTFPCAAWTLSPRTPLMGQGLQHSNRQQKIF